ncbi:hypothetical protein M569_03341 [Genlisea aurea]|uniref:HHO5-like N-terminal domain-containing protein n=1 Tax=Genlisea aurea TaxID=192259 RepID=S8CVL5_9LAMI|nr:hypothetical protein M569_03341 [Genlisea aurea]
MDGGGQLPLKYNNGYVRALEDERRKIEMLQRELPLSLEIVTQAIQACKQLSLHADGLTSSLKLNLQVGAKKYSIRI